MPQSQWIILLVAAAIAVAVLARLFMVLGRRSGTEMSAVRAAANAIPGLPPRAAPSAAIPDAPGLPDVLAADKSFDIAKFLEGARTAYGLIVTAFEKGDREALKPLVSPEVLDGFSAAIAARGATPPRFHFASVQDAAIDHAAVTNGQVEISTRFDAAFETSEGVGAPHLVTDHWTFSRAVKAADPNWTLVATSGDGQ